MDLLIEFYAKHIPASVWFLEHLSKNKDHLTEVLLDCMNVEVRTSFSNLLYNLIVNLFVKEQQYFEQTYQIQTSQTNLQSTMMFNVSVSACARFL